MIISWSKEYITKNYITITRYIVCTIPEGKYKFESKILTVINNFISVCYQQYTYHNS